MTQRGGHSISRRSLLKWGGAGIAVLAASSLPGCQLSAPLVERRLVQDPEGILDLPPGFRYRILSEEGSLLPDGRRVPGKHDGMAAFAGLGGTALLVRNHEQTPDALAPVEGKSPFDSGEAGGTTSLRVSPDRRNLGELVSSSGTRRNCAGGPTPWGTWLTCEETTGNDHGYVFEVVPGESEPDLSSRPILAMGRFSHEAAGIDAETGIVYLTEDSPPESFLYRYIPDDDARRPGSLHNGGRLEVMVINEKVQEDSQRSVGVGWAEVDPESAHDDATTKQPVGFRKLEGATFSGSALWFNDSTGGDERHGQVFRYEPGTDALELVVESQLEGELHQPDNAVMTPWGDLWVVEDGSGPTRVMGVTLEGNTYEFARNALNASELTGPCFSSDGRTFFLNIFDPGMTLAIWGPFQSWSEEAREISLSATSVTPNVEEDVIEAAIGRGLSPLEGAAYRSLGVPLA